MRVQFEVTLRELVDTSLREFYYSKANRWFFWVDIVSSMVFGVVFLWLLLPVLSPDPGPFRGGMPHELRLAIFGFAVVVCFPFSLYYYRGYLELRVRLYFRYKFGPGRHPIQVDLLPEGVRVTQKHCQITYPWSVVSTVQEKPKAIDMLTRYGDLVVVPRRAFAFSSDIDQFLEEARQFLLQATMSSVDKMTPTSKEEHFFNAAEKQRLTRLGD